MYVYVSVGDMLNNVLHYIYSALHVFGEINSSSFVKPQYYIQWKRKTYFCVVKFIPPNYVACEKYSNLTKKHVTT